MNGLPDIGTHHDSILGEEQGATTWHASAPTQHSAHGDAIEGLLAEEERQPAGQGHVLLERLLAAAEPDASLISTQRIKKGVYRLRFKIGATTRSAIIKRLNPTLGHRNTVVVTRWLPLVGLQDAGPRLRATVAEPLGQFVWHRYEDFGEASLDSQRLKPARTEQAVELIASLHMRFAEHPVLAECRLWGGDLGMSFYHANVVDAIRAVDALRLPQTELASQHRTALDSLLETLRQMLMDEDRCRLLMAEHGGPETLLHGDLWHQNILFVRSTNGGLAPRLIDWDHAAVGQVSYDLSTFLSRFPEPERNNALDLYRTEIAATGWALPDDAVLNELFDIAERCRIANRVIWPAIQISLDNTATWALDQLLEVARWFDRLEPVLP